MLGALGVGERRTGRSEFQRRDGGVPDPVEQVVLRSPLAIGNRRVGVGRRGQRRTGCRNGPCTRIYEDETVCGEISSHQREDVLRHGRQHNLFCRGRNIEITTSHHDLL